MTGTFDLSMQVVTPCYALLQYGNQSWWRRAQLSPPALVLIKASLQLEKWTRLQPLSGRLHGKWW